MRCSHKSKRSQEQCKNEAGPGKNSCHIHGGKSLKGIAAPSFKTGEHSKYLPTRMLDAYHERLGDERLIETAGSIALTDARLFDVLSRVDTGECGETWKSLYEAVQAFNECERKANNSPTPDKAAPYMLERNEQMDTILGLVQEGMADYAAWREVKDLIELRRKLCETEQKRLIAAQQMITNDQAMVLMASLQAIIHRNVTDRDTLSRIANEFAALAVR